MTPIAPTVVPPLTRSTVIRHSLQVKIICMSREALVSDNTMQPNIVHTTLVNTACTSSSCMTVHGHMSTVCMHKTTYTNTHTHLNTHTHTHERTLTFV